LEEKLAPRLPTESLVLDRGKGGVPGEEVQRRKEFIGENTLDTDRREGTYRFWEEIKRTKGPDRGRGDRSNGDLGGGGRCVPQGALFPAG